MVKKNKTLDEKTASLWLQNTGKEKNEYNDNNSVTEKDTEQVTDTENLTGDNKQPKKGKNTSLLSDNKEKLTERFELKMSTSQMKTLEKLADEYNKHKSEVMRTAFEFFIDRL